MSRRILLWAPLALFLVFAGLVALRLHRPDETPLRSQLIGQPLPAFALAPASGAHPGLDSVGFADGRPRLLNVFGSWCLPCAAETPQLLELKRRGVAIDAVAVRDRPEDIAEFLARHGDPFVRIGDDPATQVQLALGSAGVPETFVIDGRGIIRHQHVGYIAPDDVPALLAAYEAAR